MQAIFAVFVIQLRVHRHKVKVGRIFECNDRLLISYRLNCSQGDLVSKMAVDTVSDLAGEGEESDWFWWRHVGWWGCVLVLGECSVCWRCLKQSKGELSVLLVKR
jgi:hypothetical protein